MKKKSKIKIIKNRKKRGEWAELVFAARAMEHGFRLGKPWGESNGYDLAVEQESGRIVRVQVKSTLAPEGGGYTCCLTDNKGPYKGNKFDFVAAYVIPEDVWYIVPAKNVKGKWRISLHPELVVSKYGPYEEAWHLLRGRKKAELVTRIDACAEGGVEAGR